MDHFVGKSMLNPKYHKGYIVISLDSLEALRSPKTSESSYKVSSFADSYLGLKLYSGRFIDKNNILFLVLYGTPHLKLTEKDNSVVYSNREGAMFYNIPVDSLYHVPFSPHNDLSGYGQESVIIKDSLIIIPCFDNRYEDRLKADSVACLCAYNFSNKNYEILMTFPKEQLRSGLGNQWFGFPKFVLNNKNEIVAASQLHEHVINFGTQDTFYLQNLRESNKKYIEKMIAGELTPMKQYENYFGFLPTHVQDIFQDQQGNYYIIMYSSIYLENGESDTKLIIQKYDEAGKYINEIELPTEPEPEIFISSIDYDKKEDIFILALKGPENFYVSYRKWKE